MWGPRSATSLLQHMTLGRLLPHLRSDHNCTSVGGQPGQEGDIGALEAWWPCRGHTQLMAGRAGGEGPGRRPPAYCESCLRAATWPCSRLGVCTTTDLDLIWGSEVAWGTSAASASRALTSPPGGRALSSQSSTQEIGEELVNGVVYSVSLRKVQVHHGATKGQRWLGVSAGWGRHCPTTMALGLLPMAFLPEGPTVLLPKESGLAHPAPHCPAPGLAECSQCQWRECQKRHFYTVLTSSWSVSLFCVGPQFFLFNPRPLLAVPWGCQLVLPPSEPQHHHAW